MSSVCEVEQQPRTDWNLWRRDMTIARREAPPRSAALDFALYPESSNTEQAPAVPRHPWVAPVLWAFIGLVSAIDTYLTVKYQDQLLYTETNPFGRLLLQLDGWEPSLLISFKFFGSSLVLGVLFALHFRSSRWSAVITNAVALFQFGLLLYLFVV